jgi:hypothetical protein
MFRLAKVAIIRPHVLINNISVQLQALCWFSLMGTHCVTNYVKITYVYTRYITLKLLPDKPQNTGYTQNRKVFLKKLSDNPTQSISIIWHNSPATEVISTRKYIARRPKPRIQELLQDARKQQPQQNSANSNQVGSIQISYIARTVLQETRQLHKNNACAARKNQHVNVPLKCTPLPHLYSQHTTI